MITAAVVVGGAIIGGIMASSASASERQAAAAAYQRAYSQYDNLNIPDIEKQKLALQEIQSQGVLTPEMETSIQQQSSEIENVNVDPRLKQAQMQALASMAQMSKEGLTAEDMAALNASRRQVAGDAQAANASTLQNMQQRGIAGSGMELAAKLQNNQAAADRSAIQSDNLMSQAQARMLNAISSTGSLAAQARTQDFSEQSAKASAKDSINQFNANQQASTQARNVAARNNAQAANLSESQRIADQNVATRNAQQEYNKGLLQTQYDNQMQLATARANAALGQANQHTASANRTAQQWQNIGSGTGKVAAGVYAGSLANDKKAIDDIELDED